MAQLPGDARVNQYTATAGQTTFTYDFQIYDDDEITVQQGSTTLTLTTHYTVTDAGEEAGGTIVLVTGATVDDKITLTGNSMVERETTFSNGGDFAASAINGEYDKILDMISENVTEAAKSVRLAVYDAAFDTTIPTPVARKALMIDTAGTGFEMSTYDPDTQQTASAASAAAALVSENAASDSADEAAASAAAALVSENNAAASAASIDFSTIGEDMLPATDATYDLGSTTKSWAEVHCEDLAVQDDATIAGTLGVTGAITATAGVVGGAESDITLNTNMFTVDATNGNTVVAGTLTVGGVVYSPVQYAHYTYSVAEGTAGGTFTAGAWRTRPINTEVLDGIGISLASNQLTIPAGTYTGVVSYVYSYTNNTDWRLYDITNSVTLSNGVGVCAESDLAGNFSNTGVFSFVAAAAMVIEVQGWSQSTRNTDGMGAAYNVSGVPEVYLSILLQKIA